MDVTKNVARIATYVLLIIDFFFLLACYKWRWMASFQIYFELLSRILFAFVPTSTMRGLHPFIHCINSIMAFLVHYCGSILNIYAIFLVTIFEVYFGVHIAYDRHFGTPEAILTVLYVTITLLTIAALSALFEHISNLYIRLDFTNSENIKLLNGMHEGLLILSKPKHFNGQRD